MANLDSWRGKWALVTGASSGIGWALAEELAAGGTHLVLTARRRQRLAKLRRELSSTHDVEIEVLAADLGEPKAPEEVLAFTKERGITVDLLVNNAGGQFFSPAELIAARGWRAVWRLNVEGMLNMSEAAFELALEPAGAGGTIVNVTLSPHHGMPGMAHSGSARATVEALTRELALRWQHAGVSVTAVAAGHFDTEVLAKYPASVRAGASRTVPLQRLGTVAEHAWLVALLASPLGKAFSGSTVTLDGARDNWCGPWPPPGLADESGEVPTEERR